MSRDKLSLHVGSLDDMGRRFADAWRKAERGERVQSRNLTFVDLPTLVSVLSPKRLDLLKTLRASGASSIRALATALHRDYKSVHQDVSQLIAAGLIERKARDSVVVTWRKVRAEMDLEAA